MAASTPGAEAIPQYLQWKIESQRTDINLDKKLEEANKVLHNRILKMREGKLCTGCVLFVGRDHKSHWGFAGALWSRFEVVPGSTEEASLLAKKPRLNWNIIAGKSVTCTLCKAFLEAALPLLPEESNMVRPNQLSIDLHRGALTLPRMNSKTCKHRSHKANEWHGLTATFTWNGQSDDAVKYTIWPNTSRTLGPFHWGLPLKTIARALLLDLHGHDRPSVPPNRKHSFPSWSWLGWASGSVSDAFDDRYQLVPLVHIYAYDGRMETKLLAGPRNNSVGVEGYIVADIEAYNQATDVRLHLQPTIEYSPSLPAQSKDITQVLVFWSHVACLLADNREMSMHRWDGREDKTCELVLIGCEDHRTTNLSVATAWYHGLVISRSSGFVQKVGIFRYLPSSVWVEANPQLELIFLI
ncbi:hypothetical protein HBH70_012700 [Parastagonospora nodorum]|nr:hypothetical protein HBH75_040390 [Parastagonospora nodorum]KAH5151925.1 hypothetical protein HBH70_012700 [Parastagonospora nodorum]KAH6239990.1 hypothetical protein HBI15_019760 [Parastagonospora nodorum]